MKKGQLEDAIISLVLVFSFIMIIGVIFALYIRHFLGWGAPIRVESFTEYKWGQYLPFAVGMYITYPTSLFEELKAISEEGSEYCYPLTLERHPLLYSAISNLRNLKEIENKNVSVVKDKEGLYLVFGMDWKRVCESKVFPNFAPYFCEVFEYPFFGREGKKLTVALCCTKVRRCEDYQGISPELICEKDPCNVGPCILDRRDLKCKSYNPEYCEENATLFFQTLISKKKIKSCEDYDKDKNACLKDFCLVSPDPEKGCKWDALNNKCVSP